MPKRLSELYPVGTRVELRLSGVGWSEGRVVAHDFPGIWVATGEGARWFVTNHRHIRHAAAGDDQPEDDEIDPGAGQGANEL